MARKAKSAAVRNHAAGRRRSVAPDIAQSVKKAPPREGKDYLYNDLVVRGPDGDPLPHPSGVRMTERESCERVIEGLKMSADACVHLAKREPIQGATWKEIGAMLDKMRLEACRLAGLTMRQNETPGARGNPYTWRRARDRFLEGLKQATGGMRQLATCFRNDVNWSLMAMQLDRRERPFKALLYGRPVTPPLRPKKTK
jgi:hypothetical protein